jgi:hypothetical protein
MSSPVNPLASPVVSEFDHYLFNSYPVGSFVFTPSHVGKFGGQAHFWGEFKAPNLLTPFYGWVPVPAVTCQGLAG